MAHFATKKLKIDPIEDDSLYVGYEVNDDYLLENNISNFGLSVKRECSEVELIDLINPSKVEND